MSSCLVFFLSVTEKLSFFLLYFFQAMGAKLVLTISAKSADLKSSPHQLAMTKLTVFYWQTQCAICAALRVSPLNHPSSSSNSVGSLFSRVICCSAACIYLPCMHVEGQKFPDRYKMKICQFYLLKCLINPL